MTEVSEHIVLVRIIQRNRINTTYEIYYKELAHKTMDDDKSQNYSFDVPIQVPKPAGCCGTRKSDVPV